MNDMAATAGLMAAMAILPLAAITWLLHYFVALKSRPTQRAAWTAGVAYVIVAVGGPFAMPDEAWWEVPLAAVPAALIAFWWWRSDFRRSWIDVSDDNRAGVKLANDDWRVGLIVASAIIVFLALRVIFRLLARA